MNPTARARVRRRTSSGPCTTRAFGANNAPAAALSSAFNALLHARTTCAGEGVVASRAAATTNAGTTRQYPFWGTHRKRRLAESHGMRILLVDDEPALRELLRVTFESAEVTVDEAASASEALARIDRYPGISLYAALT